jgi:hypothetical protein
LYPATGLWSTQDEVDNELCARARSLRETARHVPSNPVGPPCSVVYVRDRPYSRLIGQPSDAEITPGCAGAFGKGECGTRNRAASINRTENPRGQSAGAFCSRSCLVQAFHSSGVGAMGFNVQCLLREWGALAEV